MGIDIEVAARPDRARIGRAHLDRFLDVAADFAAEADEAGLTAFLAFLEAAEDEENGLEAGDIVVDAERVQVLTVHGAKGLEWDLVAMPGLVTDVFPAKPTSINWTRARQQLPGPLRGDAADLPELSLAGASDRRQVRDRLVRHHEAVEERHGAGGTAARLRRRHQGPAPCCSPRLRLGHHEQAARPVALPADVLPFAEPPTEWVEPEPDERESADRAGAHQPVAARPARPVPGRPRCRPPGRRRARRGAGPGRGRRAADRSGRARRAVAA